MNSQLVFRVTGVALGIQLALGGLVTYAYLDWRVHMVWGVILGVLALLNLVLVVRMPSRPRRLVGLTVAIGVDILIQGLLGFATQGTGSNALAFVHFLNALAIFGLSLSGSFMAMAAARMGMAPPMATAQ
jgi:hypothetical protein